MHDTWFVIINPAAGNGSAQKKWEATSEELDRRSIEYVSMTSLHPGHVTELAHDAVNKGYSKFISVGGDGTHHELINGLLSNDRRTNSPTIAIVNAGSGNDWSRTHNIPDDAIRCADLISKARTLDHAAGLITYTIDNKTKQRYFVNVAGMALDGRVVEKFPSSLRRIPFLPGYLIAGLRQLATYRAPDIVIETEDNIISDRFLTVHAGICRYSGGGMRFVPHADPTAEDLAITCVRNISIPRLLGNIHRLYLGTLLSHPKALGFRCKQIKISSPYQEEIPIEADGEFLGYTPVSISIVPKAFKLVVRNDG